MILVISCKVTSLSPEQPFYCPRVTEATNQTATKTSAYLIKYANTWWRHQMETFSALLTICAGNSPVTGEFPAQRPVTRSFDVFFDLRLNERLSKQSWGWWFETQLRSIWRHCNEKWKCYQVDCPGRRHWGCWSLISTSRMTNRAIILTTFFASMLCVCDSPDVSW